MFSFLNKIFDKLILSFTFLNRENSSSNKIQKTTVSGSVQQAGRDINNNVTVYNNKSDFTELVFKFSHSHKYYQITEWKWEERGIKYLVCYIMFGVENKGKIKAEQCKTVLEKIWKENSVGKSEELELSPVPLKCSGTQDSIYSTIQPSEEVIYDIGHVNHPGHEGLSEYRAISEDQKKQNKFFFELPRKPYSQWDCLVPGKYKIQISVYSDNAEKLTRKFEIVWSGVWKDKEPDMFKELVIKIIPQYKGTVIEESLEDKSILKEFKTLDMRVTTEENPADRWHMYSVEASEDVIEKLSEKLKPSKWYCHFWNGTDMIVVFKGKIFRFKYSDQAERNKAIEYGMSIGLPKEQLDFLIA
jgi:hypothetical protein